MPSRRCPPAVVLACLIFVSVCHEAHTNDAGFELAQAGESAPASSKEKSPASRNRPPAVTPASPAPQATGLPTELALEVGVSDPEGGAMTVTFYGRRTVPPEAGPDFSIIAIPDSQFYCENKGRNPSPEGTGAIAALFDSQTQWIVENREARNIAFVSHMGDIVQNGDARESEWKVADAAMARLEDPKATRLPHGVPWGVAPGNHDQSPAGDAEGATKYFNQYFGTARWQGRPYFGGNFGVKNGRPVNDNNYELFSASGLDFIVLHLEFDKRDKRFYQDVLDWADEVLKNYPDRRAIVTTHWMLNTGNPATFSTQGQNIYDALKNNRNLFLMLGGHVHGEGVRSDTFKGKTVHSVLQDFQDGKNGGNGFLRIFTFSPAEGRIRVESFSPSLGRALNASDEISGWMETFDLPYEMQSAVSAWIPLGKIEVPAGGMSASFLWKGLEAGRQYEWYASASDGSRSARSKSRGFATAAGKSRTVEAKPVVAAAERDGKPQAGPISFSENFNSMGVKGLMPPNGWSIKMAAAGTRNKTWVDSIPGSDVARMESTTEPLTATSIVWEANNNGFNVPKSPATTRNRVLVTSPSGVAGVAIQWELTNPTSKPVSKLRIQYDIQRFTKSAVANELPGYWLFYSLDEGTTWTNVAALNPVVEGRGKPVVPNSPGITTIAPTDFALTAPWKPGATLLLRWVDDNAVAASPDQTLGLDNVALSTPDTD